MAGGCKRMTTRRQASNGKNKRQKKEEELEIMQANNPNPNRRNKRLPQMEESTQAHDPNTSGKSKRHKEETMQQANNPTPIRRSKRLMMLHANKPNPNRSKRLKKDHEAMRANNPKSNRRSKRQKEEETQANDPKARNKRQANDPKARNKRQKKEVTTQANVVNRRNKRQKKDEAAQPDNYPKRRTKRQKEDGETTPANNPNGSNKRQKAEEVDPHTLIPYIGWDNSINCLIRCSRSDYGAITAVNSNFRHLVRSGELYQVRRKAGIVEHWIYFSVTLLQWEAFDPFRMQWMRLPRMETSSCFELSDKESLAIGTQLLVFGRDIYSYAIYRYNLITNTWSPGKPMNFPRSLFASASIGTIGIVAGGCNAFGKVLRVAELYNSETDEWIPLPDMNIARKMCSGVFMDGKFYVLGGIGDDGRPFTCGEVFDLETQTWEVIPDIYPRLIAIEGVLPVHPQAEAPPLLGVVDNELYRADYATKEIRMYDKKSNLWAVIGMLPERAMSVHGWGLAFRACGERLMVISGPRDSFNGGHLELNSWIPSKGPVKWELLADRYIGNFVYNCTVMGC